MPSLYRQSLKTYRRLLMTRNYKIKTLEENLVHPQCCLKFPGYPMNSGRTILYAIISEHIV